MAKHLFLTILEPAKSIIRVPAWSGFWWGPFSWLTVVFFLLCLHMVEKEGAPISCMDINIVKGAPPSWPYWNLIASWKPHFLIPSHWGLGLQYMNWGDANIQLLSRIISCCSEPCAASHFFAFVQVSSDRNTFVYLASLGKPMFKRQFEESLKCSPALS